MTTRGPAASTEGWRTLVAATGELAGLIVLHFDKDFDLITEVTGQQVEWLAVDDGSP